MRFADAFGLAQFFLFVGCFRPGRAGHVGKPAGLDERVDRFTVTTVGRVVAFALYLGGIGVGFHGASNAIG
jgi:hypothetical protein